MCVKRDGRVHVNPSDRELAHHQNFSYVIHPLRFSIHQHNLHSTCISTLATMTSRQVVGMYRAILKNARHYPSRNRESIIKEAKSLFHDNKALTDPDKIARELQLAKVGLEELLLYAPKTLESDDGDWSVTLRGSTLPDTVSSNELKKGQA
jgi:LYR motif-containing protein 4